LFLFGAGVVLAVAGAASISSAWDDVTVSSASDSPAQVAPAGNLFARTNIATPASSANASDQLAQAAERSALMFDGPTRLGGFSQLATQAPVLEGRFMTVLAEPPTAPLAQVKKVLAAAPIAQVETPQPTANPFRLQSTPPAVVATREAPTPARAQVRAKALASVAPPAEKGFLQRLFGSSEPQGESALAYAPVETDELRTWPGAAPTRRSGAGERTAIYDISRKIVIMPNGERLEAHSGLGDLMDEPQSMRMKNRGVTPPNVYTLRLRESLFHGVQAIRLVPVHNNLMFGRDGILAHSYMLGPRGDSNGCVSFRDYDAFLKAFLRGDVTRLVVAENASSSLALLAGAR